MRVDSKWIDIAGQALVLASAGFQLFMVGHWVSENQSARHSELSMGIARLESASAGLPDDWHAHDAKVRNYLKMHKSEQKIAQYSLIGGIVFLIGGSLTILARTLEKSSD